MTMEPDLAPFRSFVLVLASRSPYAERQPYRLHPTLTRRDDGTWRLASDPGQEPARLEFPQRYRDAWHALEQVERRLEPAHAEAWRCTRLLLRDLAAELSSTPILDAESLAAMAVVAAARNELEALAAALDAEHVSLPSVPLRCSGEVEGVDRSRAPRLASRHPA